MTTDPPHVAELRRRGIDPARLRRQAQRSPMSPRLHFEAPAAPGRPLCTRPIGAPHLTTDAERVTCLWCIDHLARLFPAQLDILGEAPESELYGEPLERPGRPYR